MAEAEREPVFVPPKQKWRPWNSYKMQKFMYYAQFPRGRFITMIIGGTIVYLAAYNIGVYYWKGPDHPLNNYTWKIRKDKGLLTPEQSEKERLLIDYDVEIIKKQTGGFWPGMRESRKASSFKINFYERQIGSSEISRNFGIIFY
ncbi:hypothetical protein M3Y97_00289800 [Aphelenchoides bicaudatus]|nr:hypothetical protein M3Y97_00289800 [Aphelenchoides bicaudatus]